MSFVFLYIARWAQFTLQFCREYRNSLQSQLNRPFELGSAEVNSRVLTVTRQPGGNIDAFWELSWIRLCDPFERFLRWIPSEKFYAVLHFTALDYIPALAPYHMQSPFSSAVETQFTCCLRDHHSSSTPHCFFSKSIESGCSFNIIYMLDCK